MFGHLFLFIHQFNDSLLVFGDEPLKFFIFLKKQGKLLLALLDFLRLPFVEFDIHLDVGHLMLRDQVVELIFLELQ